MSKYIITDIDSFDIKEYNTYNDFPTEGLDMVIPVYCLDKSTNTLYRQISARRFETYKIVEYDYKVIGYLVSDSITIPADYMELYQRILTLLVEYGEASLKDCKANCKDRYNNVIDCYNVFQSLLAIRQQYDDTQVEKYLTLANLLKEHLEYKLDFYFGNNSN